MHVDRMIGVVAVALGVVLMSACSTSPATSVGVAAAPSGAPETAVIEPSQPPPPSRAEIPPPAPSPQALWRFGHWSWDGAKYAWVRGHYVQRPSPSANWLPGYWEQRPEGWIWIEGQWSS